MTHSFVTNNHLRWPNSIVKPDYLQDNRVLLIHEGGIGWLLDLDFIGPWTSC